MKGKAKRSRGLRPNGDGKPTAVDLFCGCGGLTVGLKRAGFRVLGAVDVDPLSVKTYKANHRDVTLWEKDIRELDPQELLDTLGLKKGGLDLLAGCPPCQGFTTMRTLNGALMVDDPRNDLLLEFERFVEALRPRAVMMENVPGLADDERFGAFRRKLKNLGYLGEHRILNAAHYGVPQRRRRLIYLAGLGVTIPFAGKAAKMKTVEDAIGGLPKAGQSGDPVGCRKRVKAGTPCMTCLRIEPRRFWRSSGLYRKTAEAAETFRRNSSSSATSDATDSRMFTGAWPGRNRLRRSPEDASTRQRGGSCIRRRTGRSPCARRRFCRVFHAGTSSRPPKTSPP